MSDKEDLLLALDYLQGRVDYSGLVAETSFKLSPDEERRARASIARLLSLARPPRKLCLAVADLFDDSDTGSFRTNRRLVIRGGSGRGRGQPRDAARRFSIIVEIKRRHLQGISLEQAIGDLAATDIGIGEKRLWEIWNEEPFLREKILASVPIGRGKPRVRKKP